MDSQTQMLKGAKVPASEAHTPKGSHRAYYSSLDAVFYSYVETEICNNMNKVKIHG